MHTDPTVSEREFCAQKRQHSIHGVEHRGAKVFATRRGPALNRLSLLERILAKEQVHHAQCRGKRKCSRTDL